VNHRCWLEGAEYLSLLGLIAGSIATVASGQLIYACVPVVISICLKLMSAEIANLQEQYASLLQAHSILCSSLELLTQESELDEILSDSEPDDEDIDALLDSLD